VSNSLNVYHLQQTPQVPTLKILGHLAMIGSTNFSILAFLMVYRLVNL